MPIGYLKQEGLSSVGRQAFKNGHLYQIQAFLHIKHS